MVRLSRLFCSLVSYDNAVLQPLTCIATCQVWALSRSLATTREIIIYFLFLSVLRCFSSRRVPTVQLTVCQAFNLAGCSIRKSAGHGLFAPHRSLSQLITSFFASESQGIRRAPFDTFSQRNRIAAATAHTFSCILCSCCLLPSGRNRILSLRFTVLLVSICQRSSVSEELRVKS